MTDPTVLRRQLERAYGRLIGVQTMLDLLDGQPPRRCARRPPAERIKLTRRMTADALAEVDAALFEVAREMAS